MDAAVDHVASPPGVYGVRMTGGGFGGCIVALTEPGALDRRLAGHRGRGRTRPRRGDHDRHHERSTPMTASEVRLLASGLRFGEGPRWHHGKLWFSDMYDHQVKTIDSTVGSR
jgi:hypothetical protein